MLHNQKGGALLTVFFILILFMVLGFSISAFTIQGAKQRAFSDDEIQGKLLADMGLSYFKEHLKKRLNNSALLSEETEKDSTVIDQQVREEINKIASELTEGDKGPYKEHLLPGGNQGSFALGYQTSSPIDYNNGNNRASQPYVRKITLYSLGLPPRAQGKTSTAKRMLLKSTVYINTVPAPFHYAVSTPGELRLFGGTNIIGDVAVENVITSRDYRYRSEDNSWQKGSDLSGATSLPAHNQPYVQGTIFLSKEGAIYNIEGNIPKEKPNNISLAEDKYKSALDRNSLKTLFSPKQLEVSSNETWLSTPKDKPYLPGYEPPLVKKQGNTKLSLFKDKGVKEYIKKKFIEEASTISESDPTSKLFKVKLDESISFEEPENPEQKPQNIRKETISSAIDKLVIRSEMNEDDPKFLPLTVRLTGNKLENVKHLYIGPDKVSNTTPYNDASKASVEMGRLCSFYNQLTTDEGPFTFNGPIYIKGNLDIVGDIEINGTIYVDGDVVIREITNIQNKNLVIIASGTIILTSRNEIKRDDSGNPVETEEEYLKKWNDSFKPLSAFLYSENPLEIYSVSSFNHIKGGIASGGSSSNYLEFNTKREKTSDSDKKSNEDYYLASRFTIEFNRKIFEKPTPGLPAGNQFFLDIYDTEYSPFANEIIFEKN